MNTNRQNEWEPLVNTLTSRGYAVLTYDYIDPHNDQSQVLADALSFAQGAGVERVVLIGASHGYAKLPPILSAWNCASSKK